MCELKTTMKVAMTAALLMAAVPAGRASASMADTSGPVVCIGEQEITYAPGLKLLVPQDVTFEANGTYWSCPVSDGVVSARYHEQDSAQDATCTAFPSNAQPIVTWTKTDRAEETSTLQVTGVEIDVVGATQVYASLGTVTSGRYQGHAVNVTVIIHPNLDLSNNCLSSHGLTFIEGTSTIEIL
jgi:hypothetical protein